MEQGSGSVSTGTTGAPATQSTTTQTAQPNARPASNFDPNPRGDLPPREESVSRGTKQATDKA